MGQNSETIGGCPLNSVFFSFSGPLWTVHIYFSGFQSWPLMVFVDWTISVGKCAVGNLFAIRTPQDVDVLAIMDV